MQFVWPIVPPPHSTPGQLFGANHGKHTGLDMGSGGDAVRAAADGVVRVATLTSDSRGRIIHVDHGSDSDGAWETRYYHLGSSLVRKGDIVTAGQNIAIAGSSGLPRPWPHLHFEVRRNGRPIDPRGVLGEEGEGGAGLLAGLLLAGGAAVLL